jgi:hypothetical protein
VSPILTTLADAGKLLPLKRFTELIELEFVPYSPASCPREPSPSVINTLFTIELSKELDIEVGPERGSG